MELKSKDLSFQHCLIFMKKLADIWNELYVRPLREVNPVRELLVKLSISFA